MPDDPAAQLADAVNVLVGDVRRLATAAQKLDTGEFADELAAVKEMVADLAVSVRQVQPSRYTEGEIPSQTASRLFFTHNPNRLGATIYNDSTSILYVKLGNQASATSFNVALAALTGGIGGYYEIPNGYTGPVSGAWASANGSAHVVELTT